MINVFQPNLGEEEAEAVKQVLLSNWLGKGKKVDSFEEKFALHLCTDRKHIISTNCCSEGLFSSMNIFDIGEGDEVIIPTLSFVGAGNAVCARGAKLVLCDVDRRTLNVTAEMIERKITPKTKAIILLHYGGVPCDMDSIMELAQKYHLIVIEDSACSVASTYKGKACGTIGDMGMWSFDAMKILVCGDGGAVYIKDLERVDYAKKLMYFGLESSSGYSNTVIGKWWEFELSQYGHRSVMNDITASMALLQLDKWPSFIQRRHDIACMYDEQLKELDWILTPQPICENCTSSYYFYHIQLQNDRRDELASYLRQNNIYTTFRYFPLHWVKYYGINDSLPESEWAALHTLCIPIHQSLSNDEVYTVTSKIKEFGLCKGL